MDKNEEFDLDFDFEKEYGFDPNTLLDPEYEDADLDFDTSFLDGDETAPLTDYAPTEPLQDASAGLPSDEDVPQWDPPAADEESAASEEPEAETPPQPRRRRQRSRSHAAEEAAAPEAVPAQPEASEADENAPVQPQRRRRKKSKQQIFKEVYLPPIIAGVALLMILIFIIGSISRGVQQRADEVQASLDASIEAENKADRLDEEAQRITKEAAALAAAYDYDGAIALLDSFSGELSAYPEMVSAKATYSNQLSLLTKWDDPSKVANLSFHVLIADPSRAFIDETYGKAYNRNFVTIDEFSKILERLYNNGYVLVDLHDIVTTTTAEDGTVTYSPGAIYLPEGKKPIMITETLVNYLNYMIDSDGDKAPDAGGAGFASKLVLQDGEIKAEMVDASGETVVGDYDLVPILNSFIEAHPDFSYQGARAMLAVCGYEGVFGYRTQDGDEEEVAAAKEIVDALREDGYTIACYSYDNINYGANNQNAASIKADLENWHQEVEPILGKVDILVYAGEGDLAEYSGNKYDVVYSFGFRYFIGTANAPWAEVSTDYFRQKRLMVKGSQLAYGSSIFNDYFNSMSLLNELRGTVPN